MCPFSLRLFSGLVCVFLLTVQVQGSRLVDKLQAGEAQTVVTYGTSLTQGGAWVGQMQTWLSSTYTGNLTLQNSGVGGSYSQNGIENLTTHVLAYNPDTVFIEFAVNDAYAPHNTTVAQSKANLNTMIDSILAAKPTTEIIIQTMNSAWDEPSLNYQAATLRPNLSQYYQGYREVAADRGLLLIDHYPNWTALQSTNLALFQSYVPDGIHPTADGLSVVVSPVIQQALIVPEPTTGMLFLVAGAILPGCRRRRDFWRLRNFVHRARLATQQGGSCAVEQHEGRNAGGSGRQLIQPRQMPAGPLNRAGAPIPAASPSSATHWRQKYFFHQWLNKVEPLSAAGGLTIVYRFFLVRGRIMVTVTHDSMHGSSITSPWATRRSFWNTHPTCRHTSAIRSPSSTPPTKLPCSPGVPVRSIPEPPINTKLCENL